MWRIAGCSGLRRLRARSGTASCVGMVPQANRSSSATEPTIPHLERFSFRLTRNPHGLRGKSALDSTFFAFPFGKPVSTFPGNALAATPGPGSTVVLKPAELRGFGVIVDGPGALAVTPGLN